MDYTRYERMQITGWPVTVLCRGARVVYGGRLVGHPGHGRFVPRAPVYLTGYPGHRAAELDPARNFGAWIALGAGG